jgi:hypothetical protein
LNRHSLAAAFGLLLCAGLLQAVGEQQDNKVSLQQVVDKPSEYHGKAIEIRGFLLREFENSALYASKEWRWTDGIWVTPTAEMTRQGGKLNRHYVILFGVFDANRHGHLGKFKGTLTVKRFELAQDDAKESTDKSGPK